MKCPLIVTITSGLLILLWSYAAVSKLAVFSYFKSQMSKQVFTAEVADILVYLVPFTELVLAGLLCFTLTRIYGFVLSAVLLAWFSIYIVLILAGVFGKIPCSCGGVLSQLGWSEHLAFNLVFLALALIGFVSLKKEVA